jgi:DNA-binding SARP family transcriptional activator
MTQRRARRRARLAGAGRGRTRAVLTGLAALAVLAALLVGLPLVLYRFGGPPLPRHVPGWHDLASRLASHDDGATALAVIRACAWLAWLMFTACVLVEAQAAVRGSRAPRLRLGGIQGAAAQLVALAALAFSAPAAIASPAAGMPAVTLDSMAIPGTAATSLTVTVHAGDCLWSIAQRYLGAGDRYPEIAALNYGRDMSNGEIFTNPSVIRPGWLLLMPSGAVGESVPPTVRPSAGPHAGHASADPQYRRRHRAAEVQGRNGVASTGGTVSAKTVVAGSGRTSGVAGSRPLAEQAGTLQAQAQLPETATFVTGALAGAILTSLTRLRFRQRQARRRGRRIALPAGADVLAAEERMRAAAPGDSVETLRHALACLETGLLATGQQLPDIVGLHVTPELLEVLLAAPAADAPPAPYAVSPGRQGMCWQLALPALAGPETPCHLLPGLVTIGVTGDGYLLLDLESLQVTGCDGPPELVDQVVSTIATELATGQWSAWYELILVGCDELASLGQAEHCDTLDAALSMLEDRCARTAQRIAERGPADVRELRLAEPDNEDWGLTILVSRAEPSADQLTRLLDLAVDSWGGLAALVAGDAETTDGRMAPTVLQLAPDPQVPDGIVANVAPLQIAVRPRALSGAEYDAIALLFGAAADISDAGPEDPPYAAYGAPPWIPQAAALQPDAEPPLPWADDADGGEQADDDLAVFGHPPFRAEAAGPGGRLEVQILGPFVIAGTAEQLQPKQAELVLALALAAPAGLSNSALCSMLGADPDHPKPSDAVRQIITRTRRRLGRASDGQEQIIHAGNGQYVLHPEAWLDWSRFRELTRSGRADDLRAALALVRGQPFTGSYFWWIDIPLIETVRAEVVDAAETLAEFELVAGAPRAAAGAARAGLAAEPSAEQLWRAIMRAEHAGGNQAGVIEAWRRCLDAIEDIAPAGEPHPDTAALYRQLTTAAPEHARTG